MDKNSGTVAGRGEGLAGAIACVKEFIAWATEQIGTSEAHGCAEQAEDALKLLEAAAPAGTAECKLCEAEQPLDESGNYHDMGGHVRQRCMREPAGSGASELKKGDEVLVRGKVKLLFADGVVAVSFERLDPMNNQVAYVESSTVSGSPRKVGEDGLGDTLWQRCPTPQASSEIREALTKAKAIVMVHREGDKADYHAIIHELDALLAPSRQGAGGK